MKAGLRLSLPTFRRCFERFAVVALLLAFVPLPSPGQTLGQALNATNLTWTTSGTSGALGWTVQSTNTHDGVLAAQSGQLNVYPQTSTLQTITNGPATMTFWWYCPSFYEEISVFVNNVKFGSIGADFGWQSQTLYLGSGSQTLKWVYSVFSSGSSTDSQKGYVDQVVFSSGATAPIINVQPPSQSQVQGLNSTFSATVVGTPPLLYQWQFNGINIFGATNSSFTVTNVQADKLGDYSVAVTNMAGGIVSSNAALGLGNVTAWGSGYFGQTSVAYGATNVAAISVGGYDGFALRADGSWATWGYNLYDQLTVPTEAANAVAISAGNFNCLALKSDGTVVAWGESSLGQTNVPAGLTDVVAIAGGGSHNLALKSDGTVVAWGWNRSGQTNVPLNLSNVVAVAAGDSGFSLALKSDGSVVVWGNWSGGVTNIPSGLTNVVAIAGRGICVALKDDGKIVAWGNSSSYHPPPADLSNVVAIAAGGQYHAALKQDGTVVSWGFLRSGDPGVPVGLTNVQAIAAGDYHAVALVGNGPPVTGALMTNPIVSTNGFSVSVPTQSGRVYRLEYKSSLADSDWIAMPLVAGNGTNLVLTDSTPANAQRFYRVRRW